MDGFGLETLNLQMENGFIKTDKHMETSEKGVYAVGHLDECF